MHSFLKEIISFGTGCDFLLSEFWADVCVIEQRFIIVSDYSGILLKIHILTNFTFKFFVLEIFAPILSTAI